MPQCTPCLPGSKITAMSLFYKHSWYTRLAAAEKHRITHMYVKISYFCAQKYQASEMTILKFTHKFSLHVCILK